MGYLDGRVLSYTTAVPPLDHIGLWFKKLALTPRPKNLQKLVRQVLGSAYWLFFQIPVIPEALWRHGFDHVWRSYLGKIEKLDLLPHASLAEDGAYGVQIYRANAIRSLLFPQQTSTTLPVQLLIMQHDPYVPAWLFDGIETFAPNARHVQTMAAGHWSAISHPDEYASHIRNFVNGF